MEDFELIQLANDLTKTAIVEVSFDYAVPFREGTMKPFDESRKNSPSVRFRMEEVDDLLDWGEDSEPYVLRREMNPMNAERFFREDELIVAVLDIADRQDDDVEIYEHWDA